MILLGTNIGHRAIVKFIKENEERAQDLLTTAISFVEDVPLVSCKSDTDDRLAPWYFAASQVFVTAGHNYWAEDISKKRKKGFGQTVQSNEDSVTEMLLTHKEAVFENLLHVTEDWRLGMRTTPRDDWAGDSLQDPLRMPAIGNFALSPSRSAFARSSVLSPQPRRT